MWMIAVTSQCTNKLTVKGPLVIVIRTLLVVVTTIAITLMGFMITIGLNRDPACITSVGRSKPMMPRTSQCHVNHDSDVGEFYQECLHDVYVCFWSPNDPLELNRGQDRLAGRDFTRGVYFGQLLDNKSLSAGICNLFR